MPEAARLPEDPEIHRLAAEVEALRLQLADMGRRLAEAERLADRDALTPLLNRRAFLRELQRAIALARRHGTPASLIYFDLDDFKEINDTLGHAAGDAVLVAVAERLMHEVRASDVVGRIGGDEFAVILQHADAPAALAKAEALAASVAGATVPTGAAGAGLRLTFGVRQIEGADSAEQALSEADAAMYLRKTRRR